MTRPQSIVSREWWDYTTLDKTLLQEAARLTVDELLGLSRDGFRIVSYHTPEDFYLAQALEYVEAWQASTADNPAGICGPIGPTEQLPLVARLVNSMQLDLKKCNAHFWGMDEWVEDGLPVSPDHPLSFARADLELCFNRIDPSLRPRPENLHFPTGDLDAYAASFDKARCVVMQGGQGEVKHWAFNDPVRREGPFQDRPPTPEEYLTLGTRVVELHPMTIIQNARTSGGGNVSMVPNQAATVGPQETWKSDKVSIWHGGQHDNPFGMRLSTLMISKGLADSACPMSLLALHPNVQFNFLRPAIGTCNVEMH